MSETERLSLREGGKTWEGRKRGVVDRQSCPEKQTDIECETSFNQSSEFCTQYKFYTITVSVTDILASLNEVLILPM